MLSLAALAAGVTSHDNHRGEGTMRELPRNIDADVVLAIGQILDDHAKMTSVSLARVVVAIRKGGRTKLKDDEIELLVVEMAGVRGLAVKLDLTGT